MNNPFRYFKTSPEVIRLAVMMYVRYPLSLRNVEDLLHERDIDVSYETVRFWWNRFGPMFATSIRRKRVNRFGSCWRWRLDEMFVRIRGEFYYLWRAIDHEGEVLDAYVTKTRDRRVALRFLKRTIKRYGEPKLIITDQLRCYRAALKDLGIEERHQTSRFEQSDGIFTPALATARTSDASLQEVANPREIRCHPLRSLQPFQSRTSSLQPSFIQAAAFRSSE